MFGVSLMHSMTKEELFDYAKHFRDMAVKQSDIITDRSQVIHDLEVQREQAMTLFFKLEKQMKRWVERIIELKKTVHNLKKSA